MKSEEAIAAWGLAQVRDIQAVRTGSVYRVTMDDGARLVLKKVGRATEHTLTRLRFEHEVLQHAAAHGVLVVLPIPDRCGNTVVQWNGWACTLTPDVAGGTQWTELSGDARAKAIRNCGSAIARLHAALAEFPLEKARDQTWTNEWPDDLLDRWIPAIRRGVVGEDLRRLNPVLAAMEPLLRQTLVGLPVQLIHRDCHGGNLVLRGEDVAGFVDCDHISFGPRVLDLAYFAVHMVKGGALGQERTAEWLELLPLLMAGYHGVVPLTSGEGAAMYGAMAGVILLFAGFFCEANNAKGLETELELLKWLCSYREAIESRLAQPHG